MAGSYAPIVKNFYEDPYEIKKKYDKTVVVYYKYLYWDLSKGCYPAYKITCIDKDLLESTTKNFQEKNNLKDTGYLLHTVCKERDIKSLYDFPVILNILTGEIVDE